MSLIISCIFMVGISELGAVGRTFAVERIGISDGYAHIFVLVEVMRF